MKLLGRWHQLAIKAQDVFSTQVLSIHYYYTRMNKADWLQIGFPLAVTSQRSPQPCGVKKWQASPFYRYPQKEVESTAKVTLSAFANR